MCMENVNAIANIEVLDDNKRIISRTENNSFIKILPITKEKITFFLSLSMSIIEGQKKFITNNESLYVQIRITDGEEDISNHITLTSFEVPLKKDDESYFSTTLVDFTVKNINTIKYANADRFNTDILSYLTVLIKTEDDVKNDRGWTIQSVTPVKFLKQ